MQPRFFYAAPPPQSVGDRLVQHATKLEMKFWKHDDGRVTTSIELQAHVGSEFFDEHESGDLLEQSRRSHDGLAYARQLLCAFAGAAKGGGQ